MLIIIIEHCSISYANSAAQLSLNEPAREPPQPIFHTLSFFFLVVFWQNIYICAEWPTTFYIAHRRSIGASPHVRIYWFSMMTIICWFGPATRADVCILVVGFLLLLFVSTINAINVLCCSIIAEHHNAHRSHTINHWLLYTYEPHDLNNAYGKQEGITLRGSKKAMKQWMNISGQMIQQIAWNQFNYRLLVAFLLFFSSSILPSEIHIPHLTHKIQIFYTCFAWMLDARTVPIHQFIVLCCVFEECKQVA